MKLLLTISLLVISIDAYCGGDIDYMARFTTNTSLSYDMQILDLVSQYRKSIGLCGLEYDEQIYRQCYNHSTNMATGKTDFGHDGSHERANNIGNWSRWGENVAYNYSTDPKNVVNMWLNSPGHKANIETPEFNLSAVSSVKGSDGRWYYTQFFIARKTSGSSPSPSQSYSSTSSNSYQSTQTYSHTNHRDNGHFVQVGITVMDVGYNLFSLDRTTNIFYYNMGLSLKIGHYRTPVQLEIGALPGMFLSDFGDDDLEPLLEFTMPIFAKLKVNICTVGYSSKFFLAPLGYYNVIRNKSLQKEFSAGGGFGFAWKHLDLLIYYKQDLFNPHSRNDKCIGTSLTLFF